MQLERIGPGLLRVTLHAYELATLTAAARWAVEGGQGELAEEPRAELGAVLKSYERELRRNKARRPIRFPTLANDDRRIQE